MADAVPAADGDTPRVEALKQLMADAGAVCLQTVEDRRMHVRMSRDGDGILLEVLRHDGDDVWIVMESLRIGYRQTLSALLYLDLVTDQVFADLQAMAEFDPIALGM